ncbi:hypothetical protein ASZ90_008491 [hydrocarbon metagenome]|uniref:Uncharacterized protein n=1 Tax=hydrocarbon metagenome TaxID=938273 RepID=A0A0W8FLK8_9ZZZZ
MSRSDGGGYSKIYFLDSGQDHAGMTRWEWIPAKTTPE